MGGRREVIGARPSFINVVCIVYILYIDLSFCFVLGFVRNIKVVLFYLLG